MKSPIKFLFACLGVAILVGAIAPLYLLYLQHQVTVAVSTCEYESARLTKVYEAKRQANKKDDSDWKFEFGGLVCDPLDLYFGSYDQERLSNVQRQLLAAQRAEMSFKGDLGLGLTVALIFLGVLPLAWYFLFTTICEVATTIRGE